MFTIQTRFHGTMNIDDIDVLTVDYEILGFPAETQFILLPHRKDSPFLYLQSVRTPSLAFVAIDPLLKIPEYQLPRNEIPAVLGDPSEWAVLCLCTLGHAQVPSVNLRSPLVFNRNSRHGGQFVLSLPYPIQYPLVPQTNEGTGAKEPRHAGTHP
jgi:flagellar assembly factor FliW